MNGTRYMAVSAFCLMFAWGCATTAPVTRLHPADYDVKGLRKIMLIDVVNAAIGETFDRALKQEIEKKGYFTHVDGTKARQEAQAANHIRIDPEHQTHRAKVQRITVTHKADLYLIVSVKNLQLTDSKDTVEKDGISRAVIDRSAALDVDMYLMGSDGNVQLHTMHQHEFTEQLDMTDDQARINDTTTTKLKLCAAIVDQFLRTVTPRPQEDDIALSTTTKAAADGAKLMQQKDFEGARRLLESKLNEYPNDSALLYNLGVYWEIHMDYDKAWSYYKKALELKPWLKDYRERAEKLKVAVQRAKWYSETDIKLPEEEIILPQAPTQ